MIPNTQYNVSSYLVSTLPIQITQIEGIGRSDVAVGTYLQLFDSCTAPAAGATALWELPVSATTQFQETLQVARLHLTEGLFLGLSTTEGTYTAATTHMDITVWTDQPVLATNTVGSKTNAIAASYLQVWSSGLSTAASKRLYYLYIAEKAGQQQYIYACPNDTDYSNNAVANPLADFLCVLPAGATKKLWFGPSLAQPSAEGLFLTGDILGTAVPNNGMNIIACSNQLTPQSNVPIPVASGVAILAVTN
ncbi:MAG: hypothetical protein KGL39_08610 [Patescibacteria group bacterium]|nr:hypothetical protein [Patescibacteria group bacterium]